MVSITFNIVLGGAWAALGGKGSGAADRKPFRGKWFPEVMTSAKMFTFVSLE